MGGHLEIGEQKDIKIYTWDGGSLCVKKQRKRQPGFHAAGGERRHAWQSTAVFTIKEAPKQ
jgi:hypothetical protein